MTRLTVLLLSLLCTAAAAQDVTFNFVPPPGKIKFSETFTIKMQATLPADYSLTPDTASADNSSFELLSFTKTGESASGAARTVDFDIKAQAFSLGRSTFPVITWNLLEKGAPAAQAKSPQFNIDILPLFETKEGEGIRDIYPPISFLPWLLILLAAAAILALLYWLYTKYGPKTGLAQAYVSRWKDERPPYQRARDRVDKLEGSPLVSAGKLKEFYIGLTSILRLYLYEEFRLDAEQMTTTDLGRELKNTGADLKTTLRAREFLQKADLVKFARLKPENAADDTQGLRELLTEFAEASDRLKAPPPEAGTEAKK